ncbi:MAG: undecaprenyl diphosphate synthase family protein, partial [Clostridia bacterium]|nr:undecaprenyl diphosphate synthase family protein [Clostridia bacterium]
FLLYQAAYAELYFSDKMFPDFSDKELDKAIVEFSHRTRRFGKTDEQIAKKK